MIPLEDKIALVVLLLGVYSQNDLHWGGSQNQAMDTHPYMLTQEFPEPISPATFTFQLWGLMYVAIIICSMSLFGWISPTYILSKNFSKQYARQVYVFAATVAVSDIVYIFLLQWFHSLWLALAAQLVLWVSVYEFYVRLHRLDVRFFFQVCMALLLVCSSWEVTFVICAQFQLTSWMCYGLLSAVFSAVLYQAWKARDWVVPLAMTDVILGILIKQGILSR